MTRLADLSPRWVARGDRSRAALIFKCPCCQKVWLTCTFEHIPMREQLELFRPEGEISGGQVVPSRQDYAWSLAGSDFTDVSVSPSVDASASGHWHGYITHGECR